MPARKKSKRIKPPYAQRTDLEKIQAQWTKLSGLHGREQWSAAVVRAATTAEIAVNLAIRREFADRSTFDGEFVDDLLLWANGIAGKFRNLLLPLLKGTPKLDAVSPLWPHAQHVNKIRNNVVHKGEFCSEKTATATIEECKSFVTNLVRLYEPSFELKDQASTEKA